jgi:hypothetical protein
LGIHSFTKLDTNHGKVIHPFESANNCLDNYIPTLINSSSTDQNKKQNTTKICEAPPSS